MPDRLQNPPTPNTSTAVLDPERTAQLRTFLTVEAAADVAHHRVGAGRPAGRRFALAALAALVLGGGLFLANALVGGPGPADVPAAVAIEAAPDGWTTVRLVDIDADPQAVVDQLEAAGIPATIDRLDVVTSTGPDGEVMISSYRGDDEPTAGAVVIGAATDGDGSPAIAGLSVAHAGSQPVAAPADGAAPDLERQGIRFGTDGSVSIRSGAGNTVVVLTAA